MMPRRMRSSACSRSRKSAVSVLAIDSRGFGRSDGDLPSEQTAYEDARAGWEWLDKRQPDTARRFMYGHSLGGAVAIDLASRKPASGLVTFSTFTTMTDMAAHQHPYAPVSLLLRQRFESDDSACRPHKTRKNT